MKFLIAGLGNIGTEYDHTRHNVGFMVLDALAQKYSLKFELKKLAYVAKWMYKSRQIILIKPTTYMNRSGEAVRYWLQNEKVDIQNLLVITDDLAFEVGTIRLKPKGSAGGHNGLADIELKLSTQNYARLRVGIGNHFAKGRQAEYVLSKFSEPEAQAMSAVINQCVEVVENFCTLGIERTMNLCNIKQHIK